MTYTLHTQTASHQAFKALIAAEYNGIHVDIPESFDAAKVASLSPSGKAPILETPRGVLFGSDAIARFLAKIRSDTGLMGQNIFEEAAVDSWVDFASREIELPACVWFYPVAGYMPFNENAYKKAKVDFGNALASLDKHLLKKKYLVGEQVTLADIAVVSSLVYPMKLVCDQTYLEPYPNVTRWFQDCVDQPSFKNVIGVTTMCKKELTAPGQAVVAPPKAKGGQQKKKGGDKKTEKKDKAPSSTPSPAKKDQHPYVIMDKKSPSKFSMNAWKKTYSNSDNYEKAMEVFWGTFDMDGWSLWHQDYNHNEENEKVFIVSNKIGGFQQRTGEIRKWAFGVMDVLGTEETVLEIKGMWLLRGDTVEHLKDANDDANWYTWTKLAGPGLPPSDEVKAQVAAYWCSEDELEGKPIQDSKIFK